MSASGAAITTVDLTRHFRNVRAVDGLLLNVPKGCVYAFLGPNGAGKTTTIRMLLGLTRPSRGEVRLFRQPLTAVSRRALLRRIGALVEAPSLYPNLTGLENLRITQQLIAGGRSEIAHVLELVHLDRDAGHLVQNYSLGMRQRLAIALALLRRPELLVLDEPTNALDPAGILEIRELLRSFSIEHGITVFVSTHLLGEAEQIAGYVGIIGRGRLLFEGSLTELRQRLAHTRVVIEVDRPETAQALLLAAGLNVARGDGLALTLDNPRREEISRIAETVVRAGLRLYQLRSVNPSLEHVFLDLTRNSNLGSSVSEDVHS